MSFILGPFYELNVHIIKMLFMWNSDNFDSSEDSLWISWFYSSFTILPGIYALY